LPLNRQAPVKSRHGITPVLPVAERLGKHNIALPFYPEIAEETLVDIAGKINAFYAA